MRERFRRGATLAVVAVVGVAAAIAGMGSGGAAVVPASNAVVAKPYEEKQTICHRTGSKKNPFRTIRVSKNSMKAHLKHGDALGPCGTAVFTMCHKTKAGKKKTVKVKGARKAARQLKKGDKLGKCKARHKPGKDKQKGKGKGKKKGPKKK